MGRQPHADQRQSGDRASAAFRELQTQHSELLRQQEALQNEHRILGNDRNYWKRRSQSLEKEVAELTPPNLVNRSTTMKPIKEQSSAFWMIS